MGLQYTVGASGRQHAGACRKDRIMSIRFSTEAANADILGEDTAAPGAPEALPADGTPRDPAQRRGAASGESGAGRPGKDSNAPGFLKDEDAGKPS